MAWLFLCLIGVVFTKDLEADKFVVNLDESPETRWTAVIKAKQVEIQGFSKYIEEKVGSGALSVAAALLKKAHIPEEYKQELEALAKISEIPYNECLVLNYIYEFYSSCTSVVAKTQDGHLLFARNLDYDFASLIGKLVIEVDFHKNGKSLYKAVTFAGLVGILTGVKPGQFAISLNQRDMSDAFVFWESVSVLSGHMSSIFSIRTAFETKNSYEDAKNYLKTVPLIAGSYFTIGGTTGNEGAVITRSRSYSADVWELTDATWHLVQTNYDHWLLYPQSDDRYHPAVSMLENHGKNQIDSMTLFTLLSTKPIYRLNNSTIHSTIMNPFTGELYNRVRIY